MADLRMTDLQSVETLCRASAILVCYKKALSDRAFFTRREK
jgi:hypothetical protein